MKPTPQRPANGSADAPATTVIDRRALAAELTMAAGALSRAARLLDASDPPAGSPRTGFAAPIGDRVTAKQLAAIHAIARRAELSREELTRMVRVYGKEEPARLTRAEASEIIDKLRALVGD
jgi:hypothetical protein